MDPEKLWPLLKDMDVSQDLIVLMENLHSGQEATVETEYGEKEWFPIGQDVRQGCIKFPSLFQPYAEPTRNGVFPPPPLQCGQFEY